jgi:hypothetical protein
VSGRNRPERGQAGPEYEKAATDEYEIRREEECTYTA